MGVQVSAVAQITDISFMSACSPCLASVDISRTAIGDQGAAWLGAATTRLTTVNANGLAVLGDLGLRALVENNTKLSHLSINNCSGISDAGLSAVATALRHSESLTTVPAKQQRVPDGVRGSRGMRCAAEY